MKRRCRESRVTEEGIILDRINEGRLLRAMEENNIDKSSLARTLGVSGARFDSMLAGQEDFTAGHIYQMCVLMFGDENMKFAKEYLNSQGVAVPSQRTLAIDLFGRQWSRMMQQIDGGRFYPFLDCYRNFVSLVGHIQRIEEILDQIPTEACDLLREEFHRVHASDTIIECYQNVVNSMRKMELWEREEIFNRYPRRKLDETTPSGEY
jgi:hypothetical protein